MNYELRIMKRLMLFCVMCMSFCGGYAQEDLAVVKDTLNHWLTYDISGNTVTDSLGVPEIMGDFEYWEADGAYHQAWEYTSLGVKLWLTSEGIDSDPKVESILITDNPRFITTKGIHIGTSKEYVLDVYDVHIDRTYIRKGIYKIDPNALLIGDSYESTVFHFTDDKVSAILMGYFSE